MNYLKTTLLTAGLIAASNFVSVAIPFAGNCPTASELKWEKVETKPKESMQLWHAVTKDGAKIQVGSVQVPEIEKVTESKDPVTGNVVCEVSGHTHDHKLPDATKTTFSLVLQAPLK